MPAMRACRRASALVAAACLAATVALAADDSKQLCTRCHDQPSSLEHIDKARSRVCYLCHNPHASMNRRFLYDIVK